MRYILLILLFLFIYSCERQDNRAFAKLKGEWLYYGVDDEIPIDEIGIIFENDTLYENYPNECRIIGRYSVNNDTINVLISDTIYSYCRIHKLSKDSLYISYENNGYIKKYYNRKLEFNNKLSFNNIYLKSQNYYSKHSEFELEINKKTKTLSFNGLGNCERLGRYEVIIDGKELFKLASIFKWSNLENLDMTKDYGSEDEWSIMMEINYNKDLSKTINGSFWGLPYQIKPVMKHLLYLTHKYGFI